MKNLRFLSLLLVVVAAYTPLKADEKAIDLTTLAAHKQRLKTLVKGVQDRDVLKLVNQAFKQVRAVQHAGDDVDPALANKALATVQKAISLIKQKRAASSISMPDSQSCHARTEISELDSQVDSCCNDIKKELGDVVDFIHSKFPCDAMIPICEVPVVIDEPGKYCVTCDLVYDGTGAAITVHANNVQINFQNHSLELKNCAAQGVLAENVREFTLLNDIIESSQMCLSTTSAAVHLLNVDKATIDNIYTKNTSKGVWVENSEDVRIQFSHFEAHEGPPAHVLQCTPTTQGAGDGAAVWISGSTGVTVDSSSFVGSPVVANSASFGVHIEAASKNITLTNDTFTDWVSSINATDVQGFLVDHCVAIASPNSTVNVMQLGTCNSGSANDVIVSNSSFIYPGNNMAVDGILLASGSGCLLENILVETHSLNYNSYCPAGIHVGLLNATAYDDVIGRNIIIRGQNYYNLYFANTSNSEFSDCQISDAQAACVFFDDQAISCVLKDSMVKNSLAHGVKLSTENGASNMVEGCQVYGNFDFGIEDATVGPVFQNLIQNNNVYANAKGIKITAAGATMAFSNISYNNATFNCINISPAIAQAPGAPSVSGGNVCGP